MEEKLKKFFTSSRTAIRWDEDGFVVWIDFFYLSDFTDLIPDFLVDGGIDVRLQDSVIGVNLNEMIEFYELDKKMLGVDYSG
ncbi:MAG: hypothetical protein ACRCW9_03975 [Cetobacterium sp.]